MWKDKRNTQLDKLDELLLRMANSSEKSLGHDVHWLQDRMEALLNEGTYLTPEDMEMANFMWHKYKKIKR